MRYAEKKDIEDFIGRPKNDIVKRKRGKKNTAMLKDDDDGDFGNKVREKKTNSTIEKKQANH
ncbi:MAG: hypothetical protein GY797_28270 [Deltaproteobacteria bacterium]|nr:hypothetical protein [Deltaproteobacteria bacterium]